MCTHIQTFKNPFSNINCISGRFVGTFLYLLYHLNCRLHHIYNSDANVSITCDWWLRIPVRLSLCGRSRHLEILIQRRISEPTRWYVPSFDTWPPGTHSSSHETLWETSRGRLSLHVDYFTVPLLKITGLKIMLVCQVLFSPLFLHFQQVKNYVLIFTSIFFLFIFVEFCSLVPPSVR